jgi:hypothetical protein
MRFIVDAILIALVLVLSVSVYKVKHRAEETKQAIEQARYDMVRQNEMTSLLHAEWGVLNTPERLQAVYEQIAEPMALQPITPQQMLRIEELPFRPVPSSLPLQGADETFAHNPASLQTAYNQKGVQR